MKTLKETVEYLIVKIGDQTYSTSSFSIPQHKIDFTRENQKNIWINGWFTETVNHLELKTPIKFEINIYTKNPNQTELRR